MLRWYEGQLIRLYEASFVSTDDYPFSRGRWWARFIPSIIDPEWWRHYFADQGDSGYEGRGPFQRFRRFATARWVGRLICRIQDHPSGQIFFSSYNEPDGRCKDCGQEIA